MIHRHEVQEAGPKGVGGKINKAREGKVKAYSDHWWQPWCAAWRHSASFLQDQHLFPSFLGLEQQQLGSGCRRLGSPCGTAAVAVAVAVAAFAAGLDDVAARAAAAAAGSYTSSADDAVAAAAAAGSGTAHGWDSAASETPAEEPEGPGGPESSEGSVEVGRR
ncbi:hypothetical protein B0T09DRAFT_123181 [Sordaria sp. MPI-SDFR-AT-0083]|nr:hypothetical protein B0T09DRAFT_123181 [Sordaria sp. MPI-SDFR-AT-0083]